MFNWILRRAIGGDTGKREIAVLILAIWFLLTVSLVAMDLWDIEAAPTLTMWQVFTPFCFGTLAGAFGLDWYWKQKNREPL